MRTGVFLVEKQLANLPVTLSDKHFLISLRENIALSALCWPQNLSAGADQLHTSLISKT